jgi:uncharacterized protein (DUF433 family)
VSTSAIATHIVLDDQGRPWIDGTGTKVIQVVLDKVAWGWDAEQIHRQYPHLPLAKIHAALSYYYDHQSEMDAEIERMDAEVRSLRAAAGESPLAGRLRAEGKLP